MTGGAFLGSSPAMRVVDPAVGGGGCGCSVQMVATADLTLPPDNTQVIVVFDDLGSEPASGTPQYDDCSLRSTEPLGDVATSSAIVVDAAHAGKRAKVSLTAEVAGEDLAFGVATIGRQAFVWVNFDGDFVDDAYDQTAVGAGVDGVHIFADGQIDFPPIEYTFAEGDVVWVGSFLNCPSLTSDGNITDVVLTIEWCED